MSGKKYYKINKEQIKANAKKYYWANRKKILAYKKSFRTENWHKELLRLYGISKLQYETLLTKQNNSCAICLKRTSGNRNQRLEVDHCHETGKIRGLLCTSCNRGLGFFHDNVTVLAKASKYLQNG